MTNVLLDLPAPVVPPAPVPYHRLARNARHRWWRPVAGSMVILVGLPLLLAGAAGAAGFVVMLAGGPDDFLGGSAEAELALTLVTLGALMPLSLFAAWWVQRRPAGTLSSVAGRLRWRWLAVCSLLALPLIWGGYGVLSLLRGDGTEATWVGWPRLLVGLAIVVLLVPLQAAGEEYFFRGWMVQGFGSWWRSPWPGVAISSLVFALAHGLDSVWGMADLVFFGVVTAVLTLRTGGLEAALGLHIVNNVSAFGLVVTTGALEATEGTTTASAAIVDMVVIALYAGGALWLARRRGVASHSDEQAAGLVRSIAGEVR